VVTAQGQAVPRAAVEAYLMDNYASFEREIIRTLFESQDWVDLFDLHERYMLSPGQLSFAVRRLKGLGIIETNGLQVKLNARGRKWVFAHREPLFLRGNRFWAAQNDQVGDAQLSPLEPYMPKLKSIRADFFRNR